MPDATDNLIPDIKFLIGLPPEKAMAYLKAKGFVFTWNWDDILSEAHAKAFTVAKVMKLDILQDIRDEVQKSLDEGITFEEFKRDLRPVLKDKGWWGKVSASEVPGYDPNSDVPPDKIVQLGSPRRLETIYRTNIRTSMNAGRYQTQMEQKNERPYLQYLQVQRPNKRPLHAKLHLKVFAADDPILATIYPPNGWGCDCRMRNLSKEEVKSMGLNVTPGDDVTYQPDAGWDHNPAEGSYEPDLTQFKNDLVKQYKKAKK